MLSEVLGSTETRSSSSQPQCSSKGVEKIYTVRDGIDTHESRAAHLHHLGNGVPSHQPLHIIRDDVKMSTKGQCASSSYEEHHIAVSPPIYCSHQ